MVAEIEVQEDLKCYHCGQSCDETLWLDEKAFCCYGCRTVYEILSANQLCAYYDLDKNPGWQLKEAHAETYAYLDEPDIRKKFLEFESESLSKITFYIPAIHCVSCIWLLENLHKIDHGILKTEVSFGQKKVTIAFNPARVKLGSIAQLLSALGYVPKISLDSAEPKPGKVDRSLVLKVTVAGFCFGNVMLFSFPEYLGIDHSEYDLIRLFSWLNIALSLPVFLYSGWDYLQSAAKSFKQRHINIDVPIAVGLLALFLRSNYDIITGTGAGYLDSFTGLVFFLLIGRWFQAKTYESLAFDRDFTSYFPLAVNRLENDEWIPVVIYRLRPNDIIQIRNMEIVPADSKLADETAFIDYSFVTGESKPVKVNHGDLVYAGGRLIGAPVTLVIEKQTSQSHLTSLWNNDAFKKVKENKFQKVIDRTARRFTWVVIGIAFATAVYWQLNEPSETWLVLTSVLMVACPCALALAAPFTFGNMLRVFGQHHLYLKNADVIERMGSIDAIVFDKTGTVTHGKDPDVKFVGTLSENEMAAVKVLTAYSTHPLSKLIAQSLPRAGKVQVRDFKEIPGNGIEAVVAGHTFRIGSAAFTGTFDDQKADATRVFVSIEGVPRGSFSIKASVRENIAVMLRRLKVKYTALLSGDRGSERDAMKDLFGKNAVILFEQSPHDKLAFIKRLQQQGKKVLMVGDGLNDAGALRQSDVGIAIADDSGVFTPASDGILYGHNLALLDKYLHLAKLSSLILRVAFGVSFFYNAIALTFAVTGHLTPLVAAILMPISSITVVGFASWAVNFTASRNLRSVKLHPYVTHHR